MSHRPPPPASTLRVPTYPILGVTFIGSLGFSIVLPFLVFLVTRWGGNALIYGILGATYSAFQLVGAPVMGRWSDLYGRRRVLLLTQMGTLASWIVFLVAFYLPDAPLMTVQSTVLGTFTVTLPLLALFMARAADGITGGNISVANAYMADITPETERSANFGKMAMASNLGFVLGPAIAGVLGATRWGERAPVLAAIAISLVATALILWRLPDTRPCEAEGGEGGGPVGRVFGQEPRECADPASTRRPPVREILRLRCVPLLLGIHFLVMLGFNFFYIAFPVHAVKALHWSVTQTGIFFSVLSLLMVVVQGPVLARLSKRFRDVTLILAGSFVLSGSFLLFSSSDTAVIYVGVPLLAFGNGVMWPSVVAALSRSAGDTYQGTVQGIAGSLGAFASILGLLVGGLVYDSLGGRTFFLAAGTIFVVFLLSAATLRRLRTPVPSGVR